MRDITCEPDFKAQVCDYGEPIDLRGIGPCLEMRPTDVYVKLDGTVSDGPSLCFVMRHPAAPAVVMQISARMLRPAILAIRDVWEKF